MTRDRWIYAGVGLFVLLVIINSTKKVELTEVKESDLDDKSFDSSKLPSQLRPPYKLATGENIRPIKRNFHFNSIGLKPRFDNDF